MPFPAINLDPVIVSRELWYFSSENKYITFNTKNLKWKIIPKFEFNDTGEEQFTADVICAFKGNPSNLWECGAEVDLTFIKKEGTHVTKPIDCVFSTCSPIFNVGKIWTKTECFNNSLTRETEIFLIWDVVIQTTIRLKHLIESKILPICDFVTPRNNDSEIVFCAEGHKLYADMFSLIFCSTVFRKMLLNRTNHNAIEMKYIPFEHCITFLRLLYRQKQQITSRNVEYVLSLAYRYDVQFLIADCENFIISTKNITAVEKLRIADWYKFSNLQMEVFRTSAKEEIESLKLKSVPNYLDLFSTLYNVDEQNLAPQVSEIPSSIPARRSPFRKFLNFLWPKVKKN